METRIAVIIPARMASVRFPGKMLFPFLGLPMIEHVRRRALLCPEIFEVVVATCDEEIAGVVEDNCGKVIMTSRSHLTGTDRVAEAVDHVDCTHVIVLQGDEPLILPKYLTIFANTIRGRPDVLAWNATSPIQSDDEMDNPSTVKCVISRSGRILLCSRKSPGISAFPEQAKFLRKILGLIAFEREFLKQTLTLEAAPYEVAESIEQSRILEHDFALQSIDFPMSYPSVNEPLDVALVEDCLKRDPHQREISSRTLALTCRS